MGILRHLKSCHRCHCSPCRCGGGWKKWHRGSCCGSGVPCDVDIVVHALQGERRIVPYLVHNDTNCPITVTPQITGWSLCDCSDGDEGTPAELTESKIEINPCEAKGFDIVIDTTGLCACKCYCATLSLTGSCCKPVRIAVCVEGRKPVTCHHDVSRLRSIVRACLSGVCGPAYVAPPVHSHCGCTSCC